jgi:uncharacterized protein
MALQAIQIPSPPRGFSPTAAEIVVDGANVIPADIEEQVNRIAFAVRQGSGGEITVVTLRDIGQRDVADVAREIGRQWGVGAQGEAGDPRRNAGVVILVVPKETNSDGRGRCRVEVGRGGEGFITDGDAGEMCRAAIPDFARRDYGQGILRLAAGVASEYAREFNFALDTLVAPDLRSEIERPRAPVSIRPPGGLSFETLFLLTIFPVGGGYHRRGGWGGGGFGGGFGGGGFGGFGGGGGFSGGGGGSSW